MAFRFFILVVLLWGVQAGAPIGYAIPQLAPVETYAPPHYDFGYAVNDPHTGDSKSQQESRRGDLVQGSYSVIDADGTKRTVDYTADPQNGFNAVVRKEAVGVAVKTVAAATPIAYAPVAKFGPPALSFAAPAAAYYH